MQADEHIAFTRFVTAVLRVTMIKEISLFSGTLEFII